MSQHRRGSIHAAGSSPVPGGHPNASSSSSSHEVQTRGIPLPGMVPSRSIHGNPMHGNPIHGFVNPLGPAGLVHSPPTHQPLLSGISHHSSVVHQGTSGVRTRPFAFARKRNEKSCGKIAVEDRDSEDHAVYMRQQRVSGGENRSWPVDAFCDVSIAFLFSAFSSNSSTTAIFVGRRSRRNDGYRGSFRVEGSAVVVRRNGI